LGEGERVGEGLNQANVGQDRLTVGVERHGAVWVELEDGHVLVEHGVAEAVDRIGELGDDGRIDVDIG
jgi:hypothetical protein